MKKNICLVIFIIIVSMVMILLFISNKEIIKKQNELTKEIQGYQKEFVDISQKIENKINEIEEVLLEIQVEMETYHMEEKDLLSLLDDKYIDLLHSQSTQVIQARNLEKIYAELLEAEKLKKVIESEQDMKLRDNKKNVIRLYQKNEYDECLKLCNQILEIDGQDLEIRFYRMSSLFLINKMDSSKYELILSDCEVLKTNGYNLEQVQEVENYIKKESVIE